MEAVNKLIGISVIVMGLYNLGIVRVIRKRFSMIVRRENSRPSGPKQLQGTFSLARKTTAVRIQKNDSKVIAAHMAIVISSIKPMATTISNIGTSHTAIGIKLGERYGIANKVLRKLCRNNSFVNADQNSTSETIIDPVALSREMSLKRFWQFMFANF